MTREEFMWFMKTSPFGFQIMGNDYYGHNEKLALPDGSVTFGEVVAIQGVGGLVTSEFSLRDAWVFRS